MAKRYTFGFEDHAQPQIKSNQAQQQTKRYTFGLEGKAPSGSLPAPKPIPPPIVRLKPPAPAQLAFPAPVPTNALRPTNSPMTPAGQALSASNIPTYAPGVQVIRQGKPKSDIPAAIRGSIDKLLGGVVGKASNLFTPPELRKDAERQYQTWAKYNNKEAQTIPEKLAAFAAEQTALLPLWISGEGAVGAVANKLVPKIAPKVAPKLLPIFQKAPKPVLPVLKGAVKDMATYAGVVAPVESAMRGDTFDQFLDREKTTPLVGAGGFALRGAGSLIGQGLKKVNNIGNDPVWSQLESAVKSLDTSPIQAPRLKPPTLKPVNLEQKAFDELQQGIEAAQNYVRHTDILAPYPPGTTIAQAFADIKTKIGVDLPVLMKNLERAQKQKPISELFPANPEKTKLAKAAGAYNDIQLAPPLSRKGNNLTLSSKLDTPTLPTPKLEPTGQRSFKIVPPDQVNRTITPPNPQDNFIAELVVPIDFPKPKLSRQLPLSGEPKLTLPGKMEPLGNGQKARSFPVSTVGSQMASPEVKAGIAAEIKPGGRGAYDPITLNGVDEQAKKLIAENPEKAANFVLNSSAPSALHTATGIRLIEHFQNQGNYERAVDISMQLADRLTKQGQAISAARLVGSLSPEGVSVYAAKQIQKINESTRIKFPWTKEATLSPETAKELKILAETIRSAKDESVKLEASQLLQQTLNDLKPAGILRKIATTQTIAQLANPKTQIRNILGNELFYRLERINKLVATPIDWARSKLTGSQRTVAFATAGQGGYWQGFMQGAKAGWRGVNPRGLETQFDLGHGLTFNRNGNPAEKFMSFLERSLWAVMKGFDHAAYNRAYNQTIGELATLRAINAYGKAEKAVVEKFMKEVSDNLADIADQYGKYVTFQDSNLISRGLSTIKRGLNLKQDFGLGDLILKYPRTPGALIARGLDYSPAGFLRSAYLLAKVKGIAKGAADPRDVTMALSRAITGTLGLTGLGWFLADKGIIIGKAADDYDVQDMQRQVGEGAYKVNLTALSRWIRSGFNPNQANTQVGDTLISYDWAQPISMVLSLGANVNQIVKGKEKGQALSNLSTTLMGGLEGGINTVAEQPLFQGLTGIAKGIGKGDVAGVGGAVTQALKGLPASFVPTLLNQARQLTDNTGRVTYDPSVLKEMANKAKAMVPGLAVTLPVAYDTLGRPRETYQNGSNNALNVLLNPAFISKYKPTPEAKLPLDLYKNTGETKQMPRFADKTITQDGQRYTLTAKEYSEFQRILGEKTRSKFESIARGVSGLIDQLSEDGKQKLIKALYDALTDASRESREEVLRNSRGIVPAAKKTNSKTSPTLPQLKMPSLPQLPKIR